MTVFNRSQITSDDNAIATLYMLVRSLKTKVTRISVENELLQHPDFPSLLSLSEVLTSWKIDNTALQLNTVEQLRELPLPFVAYLHHKNDGWYVLVKEVASGTITYLDSVDGSRTESLTDFEQKWSGIVLLAEVDEHSGEGNYANKRKYERLEAWRGSGLLAGALIVLMFVMWSVAKHFMASDWLLLLAKSIGLFASVLLVGKTLGSHNALTDQLCGLTGKTNCDSILSAPAAKLWGWLSWADLGLLYFAGGFLTVMLMGIVPAVQPILSWLSLLALPYVVFSVYYQGVIAKQWCTLCLIVQAVLLMEGVLALTRLLTLPATGQPYAIITTAFLLPMLAWLVLKPLLTDKKEARKHYDELMRFRRDPDLFRALLEKQPQMPRLTSDMHPVVIGNPEALHTITMVTNLFCRPCARKHEELEELVRQNPDMKVQVVFTCDTIDGRNTQVAAHLMAMNQNGPAQKALAEWYKQSERRYNIWAEQHPVEESLLPERQAVAQRHRQWWMKANVTSTPTLFVDGYKALEQYAPMDMIRMIQYTEQIPKHQLL